MGKRKQESNDVLRAALKRSLQPRMKRYKHTTARQVGGDDGYCWAVFVHGRERINGLTRPEVSYYRDRFEKEEEDKLKGVKS